MCALRRKLSKITRRRARWSSRINFFLEECAPRLLYFKPPRRFASSIVRPRRAAALSESMPSSKQLKRGKKRRRRKSRNGPRAIVWCAAGLNISFMVIYYIAHLLLAGTGAGAAEAYSITIEHEKERKGKEKKRKEKSALSMRRWK